MSAKKKTIERSRTLREAVLDELQGDKHENLSRCVRTMPVIDIKKAHEVIEALREKTTNHDKAYALSERIYFQYFQQDSKWRRWTKGIGLTGLAALASTTATQYFTSTGLFGSAEEITKQTSPSADQTAAPAAGFDYIQRYAPGVLAGGGVGLATGAYMMSHVKKEQSVERFWNSHFDYVPVPSS